MPDDAPSSSPRSELVDLDTAKEDADTAAAREELKQTAISDSRDRSNDAKTPDPEAFRDDAESDTLREQVSSPKKKRAHDQVEDDQAQEGNDARSDVSTDSAKDRAIRSEPETKRLRDELPTSAGALVDSKKTEGSDSHGEKTAQSSSTKSVAGETSTTAFQSSGFSKLASSTTSPFGTLASSKPSVFGGSASAQSPFGSLATSSAPKPAPVPTLSFAPAAQGAGTSPFANLGSSKPNGFGGGFGGGSTFGSAFGSSVLAKPLTSFAKPGVEAPKSEKPAKPFGAPDSEAEEDSEDDDDDTDSASEAHEKDDSDKEETSKTAGDDRKKIKLQRVVVNDGEAGESTLLQVRAKMFHLEKGEGWKERGSGMLKINVPESSVQFDESGVPVLGSFDASGLDETAEDEEAPDGGARGYKVARLIMRQDHTHRVLLNTTILPAMEFQEKASLKAVGIVFTAFEGEEAKPVSVHMRMSAANAKSFLNEVRIIQRELRGV